MCASEQYPSVVAAYVACCSHRLTTAGAASTGSAPRIAQHLLALTTAIWHNRATGQPITRTLITYDH